MDNNATSHCTVTVAELWASEDNQMDLSEKSPDLNQVKRVRDFLWRGTLVRISLSISNDFGASIGATRGIGNDPSTDQ